MPAKKKSAYAPMNKAVAALWLSLAVSACATPPARDAQAEVRAFIDRFIRAVNEPNVDDFVASFAVDATAFFPSPENAARRVGREDIRRAVAPTFMQGPGRTIVARDLTISVAGDTAYVSFDAGVDRMHARRTLVLRRIDGEWAVAHLHASNVSEK
jgi:ketosteroid isomerase-like protein